MAPDGYPQWVVTFERPQEAGPAPSDPAAPLSAE
jgi:hypothetical protein